MPVADVAGDFGKLVWKAFCRTGATGYAGSQRAQTLNLAPGLPIYRFRWPWPAGIVASCRLAFNMSFRPKLTFERVFGRFLESHGKPVRWIVGGKV